MDPFEIVIDPSGDLIIKVTEYDRLAVAVGLQESVIRVVHLKVSREVLRRSSMAWKAMLDGPWIESSQQIIELKGDTVISLELWFRCLHGKMDVPMTRIKIAEVWEALEVARKYFLKKEMLNSWFTSWFIARRAEGLSTLDVEKLLYPCLEFEHIRAFAELTKMMVYIKAGHITEINPTSHRHLHLRPLVIQQMNAARGSLRGHIHRGIFNIFKEFLNTTCTCKEKALFQYCKALNEAQIWPLEHFGSRKSIRDMSLALRSFRYDAPEGACGYCSRDLTTAVRRIGFASGTSFDGLCLRCMNESILHANDADASYWTHNVQRNWSAQCGWPHGQPTWYFSYMGRRQEMDAHKERERNRKREGRENWRRIGT